MHMVPCIHENKAFAGSVELHFQDILGNNATSDWGFVLPGMDHFPTFSIDFKQWYLVFSSTIMDISYYLSPFPRY